MDIKRLSQLDYIPKTKIVGQSQSSLNFSVFVSEKVNVFLFYFFLISPFVNALTPIEGGSRVSWSNLDYTDVLKIEANNGDSCTGTRVSDTKFLTAAHCVAYFENNKLKLKYSINQQILGLGKVVGIEVHPQYSQVLAQKSQTQEIDVQKILRKKETLFDVAFLILEKRETQRTRPYPEIINKNTKLPGRRKLEILGYGTTSAYWDGTKYSYSGNTSQLNQAESSWDKCPINFFSDQITALEKFNDELNEHLSIKAQRIHTISNGVEFIDTLGEAMVLPGDSGSPAIERDVNNHIVITALSSNINPYLENESGEASLEVIRNGKLLLKANFEKVPDNWGDHKKRDQEFEEVERVLQENGIESTKDNPLEFKRKYKRVTRGNFSDLSHPENQIFIRSIMSK